MSRITARPIVTDVIYDRDMFTFALGYGSNKPCVHKSVGAIEDFIDSHLSVSAFESSTPVPTASDGVDFNFPKYPANRFSRHIRDNEKVVYVHNTSISGSQDMSTNKLKEMEARHG